MKNSLRKLFGTSSGELDRVREDVANWTAQFNALNSRVSEMEAGVERARESYFANPSEKTFDELVLASRLAKDSRETLSDNSAVYRTRCEALVETKAVRSALSAAFQDAHRRLVETANQFDEDERVRCEEIGIAFVESSSALALRRKAERCDDAIQDLARPEKPCWALEAVLRSL